MRLVEQAIKDVEPWRFFLENVSEDACIRVDTEVVFALSVIEGMRLIVGETVGAYTELRYPEARLFNREDS